MRPYWLQLRGRALVKRFVVQFGFDSPKALKALVVAGSNSRGCRRWSIVNGKLLKGSWQAVRSEEVAAEDCVLRSAAEHGCAPNILTDVFASDAGPGVRTNELAEVETCGAARCQARRDDFVM